MLGWTTASPDEQTLDRAALERLYVELEVPLYNVVYRWLWDPEDAAEVVQEAFVRLWRMRSRVHVRTVRPLAYRIAVNLAASRRRWRRLRSWISVDSPCEPADREPALDDQAAARQREAAVRRAVDALPDPLREVLILCELAELTYAETAAVLGIPPGTVASRRHAAVRKLSRLLARKEDTIGTA